LGLSAKVLNFAEDAHVETMSTFETDEHLRGCRAARGRTRLQGARLQADADTFEMVVIGSAAAKHIDRGKAEEPAETTCPSTTANRGIMSGVGGSLAGSHARTILKIKTHQTIKLICANGRHLRKNAEAL
jgi:hypothetical protein